MAPSTLPFTPAQSHGHKGGLTDCPSFRMLPEQLQEESRSKAHLLEYLHALPVEKVGIPQYVPNLIYPIKDNIYIHVYPDESDIRDYYIAIEPG